MNISYHIMKTSHTPDINIHAYTKRDVLNIFKRDRIYLREEPIEIEGYYEVDELGREHIVINCGLDDMEWLRTALHEMTHHFIDHPIPDEVIKLCRDMETLRTRADINAEAISLILMFPFWELERYLISGDIRPELLPYVEERLQILNDYGI